MNVARVKKFRSAWLTVCCLSVLLVSDCSLEIEFPQTVPPVSSGSIELTVVWPENVDPAIDDALVTIDDAEASPEQVSLGAYRLALTAEVEPGTHVICIFLSSGDQDRATIHVEAIVPDEEPFYESVELTLADFSAPPPEDPPPEEPPPEDPPPEDGSVAIEITLDLPQDESITFNIPQDIEVLRSQSLTVGIIEPFDAYVWRLDGTLIAGASESALTIECEALAPGIHRLTVIVEKNGRLFSNSMRFRVIN